MLKSMGFGLILNENVKTLFIDASVCLSIRRNKSEEVGIFW
jgi:hypothetical protein